MSTFVYGFEDALPEDASARELLGGKGAGLAEMTRLGVPVPPGFTITTDACLYFMEHDALPSGVDEAIANALAKVEQSLGKTLGGDNPLLVSVRSGARASMPGMMDTVLNLGLNDETVAALAMQSGDERFAYDAYRRFCQMFGDVVMDVPHARFEERLRAIKEEEGDPRMADSALSAEALKRLVARYQEVIAEVAGEAFPSDPRVQLDKAIRAVFASWNNRRAIDYRRMQHIPDSWGTACNVQAMVFGNMGDTSGSGVAFTRNPSTGQRELYGEFLPNAQGEDVVAGIRTPFPLVAEAALPGREDRTFERAQPEAFAKVVACCAQLETHFGDMQDVEFTVERGEAFILQTRTGKRTGKAAVRIAVDMVKEGARTKAQAIQMVDADALEQLLHSRFPSPDELEKRGVTPLASGLPASPGAATGIIVFDADEAEARSKDGEDVILVRRETSPEDIHGMRAARGVLTATGGMTSHAAVVARGLGKCCVAGCSALTVDYRKGEVGVRGGPTLKRGDVISLDGSLGKIYAGALDVIAAAKVPELDALMAWADETRRLRVRANADTPKQAREARAFGAEGIGLCRTEHMFFAEERLEAMRCVVLAEDDATRATWLAKIEPMQREDFVAIFEAMDGLPVTIRLLDWPLHEFLPKTDADFASVAAALGVAEESVRARAVGMHEINPMLGHRAVRVGLTTPAIYQAQVRAIISAAASCLRAGVSVHPEIMIPVVGMAEELAQATALVRETAASTDANVKYAVGTMLELPRACLTADALAQSAEFFSFGTNDLTQTTFGISRDDAGRFLPAYIDLGILARDPFSQIDEDGVGALVRIGVERGRATRPGMKIGVCGEHGGDPTSIAFCDRFGLDYVSCSPPRLPVARLAAAQSHLVRDSDRTRS